MGHLNKEIIIPNHCAYLVEWFWDLSACRSQDHITMLDISAWAAITGNIATRDDVEIIRKMDGAYLKAMSEEQKAAEARRKAEAENG